MAGNPFRAGNRRPMETEDVTQHSSDPDNVVPKTKNKAKKRVKILSPPQSPVETRQALPRRLSDGLTGSPPPPLRQGAPQEDDDDSSDDEGTSRVMDQALLNARRNSGSDIADIVNPVAPSIQSNGAGEGAEAYVNGGMRAPYNPFARTLATSDAAFGLQPRRDDSTEESADASYRQSRPGRPVLDVDQFKDILLNGTAVPTALERASPKPQPSEISSKDTSSIQGRNAMFDSFAHPESPRMSWDHDRTNSDDGGDEGDESTTLMSLMDNTRLDTMAPPAPPKNKTGKVYPQTVSFADFDESIPSGFIKPGVTPNGTQHVAGILRPQISRSSSDLNKPLPRLPPGLQSSTLSNATETLTTAPAPAEQSSPVKPSPPPPPVSRRQGQTNTVSSPPRIPSGSVPLSIPKSEEPTTSMEHVAGKATGFRPPPPPPSRRAQQNTSSNLPITDHVYNAQSPTPDSKATLPLPRRAAAKPSSTLSRTSSNASYRSTAPSDTAAPPPPPPRRDRSSKRNSFEAPPPRRSSDQRSRNGDFAAGQDIAEVDETETPQWEADRQVGADMLKDLDALQAEIDALRARQGEGG